VTTTSSTGSGAQAARLAVGDRPEPFALPDQTGTTRSLQELLDGAERGLIVYFYPQALTPACAQQACDARDRHELFLDAGYRIVGVSPDPVERLARAVERTPCPSRSCPTRTTASRRPGAPGARRRTTDARTRASSVPLWSSGPTAR
jgi:hypothetical protein